MNKCLIGKVLLDMWTWSSKYILLTYILVFKSILSSPTSFLQEIVLPMYLHSYLIARKIAPWHAFYKRPEKNPWAKLRHTSTVKKPDRKNWFSWPTGFFTRKCISLEINPSKKSTQQLLWLIFLMTFIFLSGFAIFCCWWIFFHLLCNSAFHSRC